MSFVREPGSLSDRLGGRVGLLGQVRKLALSLTRSALRVRPGHPAVGQHTDRASANRLPVERPRPPPNPSCWMPRGAVYWDGW